MSNCIEFKRNTGTLMFKKDELSPDFFRLVKEANEIPDDKFKVSDEVYTFYWVMSKNVSVANDHVVIELGAGRSSHTWRDFRHTLVVLEDYYTGKPKELTFVISDEFDGFLSEELYPHTLG